MTVNTRSTPLRFALIAALISCGSPAFADEPAAESKKALDAASQLFGDSPAATSAKPSKDETEKPKNGEPAAAASAKPTAAKTAATAAKSHDKFKIYTDYASAVRESQLNNRPLLVVLGARWCSWCRKLDGELEKPDAETTLKDWVVVKIDVDDEPEIAKRLDASALPALRVLGPWQSVVASQEGFLELPQLEEWLAASRTTADPAKYAVLYDTAAPNEAAVEKLIAMLGETSPMARNAAMERLAAHPGVSAGAIVQILKTGRLVQQLSACDVLRRWQAPLRAIDPWQPDSLATDEFDQLVSWSRKQLEAGDAGAKTNSTAKPASAPDPTALNDLLLRLTKADPSERGAVIAQLLGLGPSLSAEVRLRLAKTDSIDDAARESLCELLYNLLASRKLRMQNAGTLGALAHLDLDSHRQAASTLLEKAELVDEPLIDELSHDPEPLIRELAIRALARLQLLASKDRIRQLLGDSDSNVRAAVLRALAERPSDASVESLCAYLQHESNEDLLVHGAKCLGHLPRQTKAMAALAELATNKSWRVRAAAIDAIGQAIEGEPDQSPSFWSIFGSSKAKDLPSPLSDAVLAAAFEHDAFVADRAAKLLPNVIKANVSNDATIEKIAQKLADSPEQLQKIIVASQGNPRLTQGEDHTQETFAPLAKPAKEWLKQKDARQVARAAVILGRFAPTELNDRMGDLIGSSDPNVRLIALRAVFRSLADYRKTQIEKAIATWAGNQEDDNAQRQSHIAPWYDPKVKTPPAPESSKAESKPAEGAKPAPTAGSDAQATAKVDTNDSPPPNKALDLANSLFGSLPVNPKAASQTAAAADESVGSADVLPSTWMEHWQKNQTPDRPPWLAACDAPLSKLLTSSDATERLWANAVWLALGHTDHADQLLSILQDKSPAAAPSSATKTESSPPPPTISLAEILPWLPPDARFEKSKELAQRAAHDPKELEAVLQQCTLIDDPHFADWLLDSSNKPPLKDALSLAKLTKALVRTRVGGFADAEPSDILTTVDQTNVTLFSYNVTHTVSQPPVPRYAKTLEWLRQRYRSTTDLHERALALAVAAWIDHKTAVDASLAAIAEAKNDSDLLTVALAVVFSDGPQHNGSRAVALLSHRVPSVQRAALAILAAPVKRQDLDEESRIVPTVADDTILPNFWRITEPLPKDVLRALASTGDVTQQTEAKLLLLASGEKQDLEQLEHDLPAEVGDQTKLYIATALAKAKRTDAEAVGFYRDTYRSLSDDAADTRRLVALYQVLHNPLGDDVSDLRSQMRKEKGAQLFDHSNDDQFGP